MQLPRQIWIVFVLGTLNSLGWSATMPFLAVYLEVARHVPLSIIGLAYLATGLVTLVSQLIGGRLTDSLGPKRVLLTGYGSSIVASIVLGLTLQFRSSVEIILLLYPIFSFVRTFSQPATFAIVSGESTGNVRTGFSILAIGGNLGFAIGPALGGILAQVYSYSTVFLLSAASAVVVGLITLFMIEGGPIVSRTKLSQPVKRFLNWREDKNLIVFLVLTLASFLIVGYETTPLSLYVAGFLQLFKRTDRLPLCNQWHCNRDTSASTYEVDRKKIRTLVMPMIASSIAAAVAFFVASVSTTFLQMEIVTFIVTLGEIFQTVPAQTVLSLFSKSGNRGTYQGYYAAVTSSGRSLASFFGPLSFSVFFFRPS